MDENLASKYCYLNTFYLKIYLGHEGARTQVALRTIDQDHPGPLACTNSVSGHLYKNAGRPALTVNAEPQATRSRYFRSASALALVFSHYRPPLFCRHTQGGKFRSLVSERTACCFFLWAKERISDVLFSKERIAILLYFKEHWEKIAHGRFFVKNDGSESLLGIIRGKAVKNCQKLGES